jgi:hypothetical protein
VGERSSRTSGAKRIPIALRGSIAASVRPHDRRAYGDSQARGATQQIAEAWNVIRPNVSQIERTPDIYPSTLRRYVAALGGRSKSTLSFPTRSLHCSTTVR